jgi:thiol-disulfide isomerase/thioredoxin
VKRFVGAALVALLLAGCAPSSKDDDPFIVQPVGKAKIDVDTPALRAQKAAAGIAPCAAGTSHNELPAGELACLGGGKAVDLSSLKGPLVVNLWASWCTPCKKELPVYGEFARRHGDVVPVIGINYQDTHPDYALQLLADSLATYPEYADTQGHFGGATFGRLSPDRILPVVVLVGADGQIAHVEATQIHELGELEQLVRDDLGVTL